jgi:FkbM family methyltransferase
VLLHLKNVIAFLFSILGFRIIRKAQNQELQSYISNLEFNYRKIKPFFEKFLIVDRIEGNLWEDFLETKSQFGQEIFVLALLNWKREGYFVEFGALDGVAHSNTFLLESKYGWSGLLAEPAKEWHSALKLNRKCKIDERAVWSESDHELIFRVTNARGLSTLDQYWNSDGHARLREAVEVYPVQTVSLVDLLESNEAPRVIDYLSVDTEGSEVDIFKEFPFERYQISVISVEHNHSQSRAQLSNIMRNNGFVRLFEDLSQIDDWYVRSDLIQGRAFRRSEGY